VHSADEVEDLEFLDDLQDAAERAGLSWRHLEFSEEFDADGRFLPVAAATRQTRVRRPREPAAHQVDQPRCCRDQ